jgi:GTPase SAR1 family protein
LASAAKHYYKAAALALLVYDVTRPDSLEALKYWAEELEVSWAGCTSYFVSLL